jgi:hypothetical protein
VVVAAIRLDLCSVRATFAGNGADIRTAETAFAKIRAADCPSKTMSIAMLSPLV